MIVFFIISIEIQFQYQKIVCNSSDYTIMNCFFYLLQSVNENGGAINYDLTSNTFLNIVECIFHNCRCFNGQGGAIYFYNTEGECSIIKFCGIKCFSNVFFQFGTFVLSNLKNNSFILGTLSTCSNDTLNNGFVLNLCYGYDNLKFLNLSNNVLFKYSFTFYTDNNFNLSFCSIIHNMVMDIIIFLIGGVSSKYLNNCNFINNSQCNMLTQNYAVFSQSSWGNLEIYYFIFLNNSQYGNKKLFAIDSGTIIIKNSFIDSFSSTHNPPTIINSITNSLTFIHSEICTYFCYINNCFITSHFQNFNFKYNIFFF